MMRLSNSSKFSSLTIYAVIYLSFIYVPVLFLPLFSFNDSIYVAFPLKGFTLDWYESMSESKGLVRALTNSIKVGVVVAVLSTILGTLAAKALTRYRMPGSGAMIGVIMIPLVIPGIIIGIALLVLINAAGVELSLFTIGLAHLPECTAFSMLVMMSRLEGFEKQIEEASLDLGEGAWMTFWLVTFPLAMPGIVASLLLTFTISFDEFILAFFLAGQEVTLPIYIWSQLRFPAKLPSVLALGTLILVASFVLVTFAEWFRRRGVQIKSSSGV